MPTCARKFDAGTMVSVVLTFSLFLMRFIPELPPNAPRRKASAYISDISTTWNAMTKEQQQNATSDALVELQEHRENKITGHHNNPRSAFQDARTSLDVIQQDVSISTMKYLLTNLLIA